MYLYERLQEENKRKKQQEEIDKLFNNKIPIEERPLKNQGKRYVALMGSMSHTYGNALAFMQNYILHLFPDNMFKTIHVNSKIAHRQLRSTPHEYLKKSKPMIAFRPRIPAGHNEDVFLKGTPLIEKQTDIYNTWGGTNLQDFIMDPDNDLMVKFQMNRTVMYIDVIVILQTLMDQLNYMHYLENAVRIEHPFMLPTCLESYLPEDMLSVLSKLSNKPIFDEDGCTRDFLEYLNGHSIFPITYKLAGSSRRREFYRYYPVDVDTIITDLDKDDGDRVGHIMNQYQLSFTVRMEFYSTGFYYIFSDNLYDLKLPAIDPTSSDIIPIYTDTLLKEDLNLREGWSLYNRASCVLDKVDDVVNIKELLNYSIEKTVEYYIKNGLPIEEFLDIKVRKQGIPIIAGKDYSIDYNTFDVKFYRADTFHTYSIIICINVELVNNLIKQLYNLK